VRLLKVGYYKCRENDINSELTNVLNNLIIIITKIVN